MSMIPAIVAISLGTVIVYSFLVGCTIAILFKSNLWKAFANTCNIDSKKRKYDTIRGVCIVFAPVFISLYLLLCVGVLGYKFTRLIMIT